MNENRTKYDWFECRQQLTTLVEFPLDYNDPGHDRPFSGSQMGRRSAFKNVLPKVDDDYLYRSEDIVFADLVEREGFKYGRVDESFHYHQHMLKPSPFPRHVTAVFDVEMTREEKVRASTMQAHALVKYLAPNDDLANQVWTHLGVLQGLNEVDLEKFQKWAEEVNPAWHPFLKRNTPIGPLRRNQVKKLVRKFYRMLFKGEFKSTLRTIYRATVQ